MIPSKFQTDQFWSATSSKLSCSKELALKCFRFGWKTSFQHGDVLTCVSSVGGPSGVPKSDCELIAKHIVAAHTPKDDPGVLSAAELYDEDIEPPKWVVPNLLPQGLAILAGKPKVGKSWMALDLALCVSGGGMLFDELQCSDPGDVLYLALEDTPARIQSRMKKLSPEAKPSKALDIILRRADDDPTQWLPRIRRWLKSHPDARLVVVDTLQMIRQPSKPGTPIYESDYKAVGELKTLADEHGVALVMVHHQRKAKSDDPMDTISGSTGLTGAADTLFVLQREGGSGNASLRVTGRDVDSESYSLMFDKDVGRWKFFGAAELPATELQVAIVGALNGKALSPSEIAEKVGKEPQAVKDALPGLLKKCLVMKLGHGQYVSGVDHLEKSM